MTPKQEQQLFNTLRSTRKEIEELKKMLIPHKPKEDEFLNTNQARKMLLVGTTKMQSMLKNGELPFATKVGSRWRFSKNGIIDYLSRTR